MSYCSFRIHDWPATINNHLALAQWSVALTRVPLHSCHVDGLPCDVVDSVLSQQRSGESDAESSLETALVAFANCLPCPFCREAKDAVGRLAKTRLGKHERNILRYAPGPNAKSGAILDPELSTHSDRETYLRAIRKLSRVGLVEAGRRLVRVETQGVRKDGSPVSRYYAHRTLKQTRMGAMVVEYYRKEIELGRAIRWCRHIADIRNRLMLPVKELLSAFGGRLDAKLESFAARAHAKGTSSSVKIEDSITTLRQLREALQRTMTLAV